VFGISEKICIALAGKKLYKITFGLCRALHREALQGSSFVFWRNGPVSYVKMVFFGVLS